MKQYIFSKKELDYIGLEIGPVATTIKKMLKNKNPIKEIASVYEYAITILVEEKWRLEKEQHSKAVNYLVMENYRIDELSAAIKLLQESEEK